MGKQKLYMGVIVGAVAGGLTALCDKDTRAFAKSKWGDVLESVKNPTDTLRNLQDSYHQLNQTIDQNAENAINALGQVEETMNKLSRGKKKPKRIN